MRKRTKTKNFDEKYHDCENEVHVLFSAEKFDNMNLTKKYEVGLELSELTRKCPYKVLY